MAQLSISINGHNYTIACDDGQEERIRDLAEGIDKKVQGLVSEVGQVGDNRLLVMAGLLVADELAEIKESTGALSSEQAANTKDEAQDEGQLAEGIDHLAQRVEAIASRLK